MVSPTAAQSLGWRLGEGKALLSRWKASLLLQSSQEDPEGVQSHALRVAAWTAVEPLRVSAGSVCLSDIVGPDFCSCVAHAKFREGTNLFFCAW